MPCCVSRCFDQSHIGLKRADPAALLFIDLFKTEFEHRSGVPVTAANNIAVVGKTGQKLSRQIKPNL